MSTEPMRRMRAAIALLVIGVALYAVGCETPNPKANTPTSGHLVVFVDELYAPLFQALTDTFMLRSPNAKVEIRPVAARNAVQALLDAWGRDTSRADTSVVYAIIIGRTLLPDELDLITKGGIDSKEYLLARDGVALVVPNGSPLNKGTREGLQRALAAKDATMGMIDSAAGSAPLRFILTDQNSSTLGWVRHVLTHDSNVAAPARYFSTGDSVMAAVRAGEGMGLLGWWRAHRDSASTRTLPLGFVDSNGGVHPPAIIHPTSLVTDAYPLKLPIAGYTFASNHSLAVGFLAWMARSQDAQYTMARQGLQPENVKIRIVMPATE